MNLHWRDIFALVHHILRQLLALKGLASTWLLKEVALVSNMRRHAISPKAVSTQACIGQVCLLQA